MQKNQNQSINDNQLSDCINDVAKDILYILKDDPDFNLTRKFVIDDFNAKLNEHGITDISKNKYKKFVGKLLNDIFPCEHEHIFVDGYGMYDLITDKNYYYYNAFYSDNCMIGNICNSAGKIIIHNFSIRHNTVKSIKLDNKKFILHYV